MAAINSNTDEGALQQKQERQSQEEPQPKDEVDLS